MSRSSFIRPLLRRLPRAIALLLRLLLAAVLLAWLTGRLASDRWTWSQWLLWIPTIAAVLAAALGLLLVVLVPPGRSRARAPRVIRWLLTLLLLTGHYTLVDNRLLRFGRRDPQGLRIVHWNLTESMHDDPAPYAQAVIGIAGDLTILTNAGGSLRDETLRTWIRAGRRSYRSRPFAVLTNLPLRRLRMVVASDEISVALLEIDMAERLGRPLVLYLVDLPSDPRRPRHEIARRARAMLDEADLPPPDLVVGDLNMTRDSAALTRLFPTLRHAFSESGRGLAGTFHRVLPLYHIDHVLLADSVRATRYDIVDPGVSRHRAQVVWVEGVD